MTLSSASYHHVTSYERQRLAGQYLDWRNQPTVYKTYPHMEPLPLPRDVQLPGEKLSSLLKAEGPGGEGSPSLNLQDLSRVFLLTYSLTAKAAHTGGEFYYRSAASAGALYPTEIYGATRGVHGLDDGLYHFSIAHHGLILLREGDLSAHTVKAVQAKSTGTPVLAFFLSAIFFRSAWKYRERSYRYNLLDTGHVIENLTLALTSLALPLALSYDFDDGKVNRLLGLDETKEVVLAVSGVLESRLSDKKRTRDISELGEDIRNASQVAQREIDYPTVREMHRAGAGVSPPPGPGPGMVNELGLNPDAWTKISPPATWPETMNHAECVFRRRSRRNYVPEPISQDCLMSLLEVLCATGLEAHTGSFEYHRSVGIGFLVGDAEGLGPGLYLLDLSAAEAGTVAPGFFRDRMAHICLDQAWLANAAVHFLFMTNLEILDCLWGARGYRYAMMTAGRMGERLYLAATAMDLGCCGIGAFYDEEAAKLLGLNKASRLLYLVAVGPVKTTGGSEHEPMIGKYVT